MRSSPGDRIHVSLQDRWAIVGATGTGKTFFDRALLRYLQRTYPAVRVYILDTKAGDDFRGYPGIIQSDEAPAPLKAIGSMQVWRPAGLDVAHVRDREAFDKWFGQILHERKPAIVLVNEVASIGGTQGRGYPANFTRLLKLGRGLDISVITETQRAAGIPPDVMAQMTHLVRFNLRNKYDARTTDEQLFDDRKDYGTRPPRPYGFFYRRVDSDMPMHVYERAQDFFGE